MSMGSVEGGFIFIRVPRTGSTTLLNYLTERYPDLEQRGYIHLSAKCVMDLWGEDWHNRHTFGCIRNPWEWLVSFYNAGISASPDPEIKETWAGNLIEPADTPGIHAGQRSNFTFDAWVRQRKTTPADWLMDDDEILVDEIRRFEDIAPQMPLRFSAVPHAHYTQWYDDELVEFVAHRCRREIEIGNYEFGA